MHIIFSNWQKKSGFSLRSESMPIFLQITIDLFNMTLRESFKSANLNFKFQLLKLQDFEVQQAYQRFQASNHILGFCSMSAGIFFNC